MKIKILFMILLIMLPSLIYAGNWHWWKGYLNVSNITAINWNGIYNNYTSNSLFYYNTGPVSYVYVGNVPYLQNTQFPIFSGYDANNDFVGNVTGFSWLNGWLLSNRTQLGSPYTTLSVFYNANTSCTSSNFFINNFRCPLAFNDYFNSYQRKNITACTNFQTGFYFYGNSKLNQLNSNVCSYNLTSVLNGYYNLHFITGIPYTIQSFNSTNANYSLHITIFGGLLSAQYSFNSVNSITPNKISAIGTFGTQTLIANNPKPPNIYINSNPNAPYLFLSYNSGIYGENPTNGFDVFNTTNSLTEYSTFAPDYGYSLKLYFKNITNLNSVITTYYIVPAYTSNYIIKSYGNKSVQNPPAVNVSLGCSLVAKWVGCYQYRQLISNLTWQFSFNTNSILNFPVNRITQNNVQFTLLNATHYVHMGNSCQNVDFEAYNPITGVDEGQVPFYTLNCNATSKTATFLLYYTTMSGYSLYPAAYMYWGLGANQTNSGTSNSVVANNWYVFNNAQLGGYVAVNSMGVSVGNIIPTSNTIIFTHANNQLFSPLPLPTRKNQGSWSSGSGVAQNDLGIFLIGLGYNHDAVKFYAGDSGAPSGLLSGGAGSNTLTYFCCSGYQQESSTHSDTMFFAGPNYNIGNIGMAAIIGSHIAVTYEIPSNSQFIYGDTGNTLITVGSSNIYGYFLNTTTTNVYLSDVNLYSQNYSFGGVEYRPGLPNNSTILPNEPLPPSNGIDIGNFLTAQLSWGAYLNKLNTLGLALNTNLEGFILPKFYIAITTIIISIILIIISKHGDGLIIGFGLMWLSGLIQIQLLPVAIIITLAYIVYKGVEHHNDDKNINK